MPLLYFRRSKHNFGDEVPSEAIGDYKICLYDLDDKSVRIKECEAAVKYRLEVIKGKPRNMQWFTNNDYQKRKIEMATGLKAELIEPLMGSERNGFQRLRHLKAELIEPLTMKNDDQKKTDEYIRSTLKRGSHKTSDSGLTLTDNRIIDIFRSTRMMFSAVNLENMLPDSYDAIRWSLRKLNLKGRLKSVDGKPMMGTGRGRPEKFFYLAANDLRLEEAHAVQRHIILSFVFCSGTAQRDWRFVSFDASVPALTIESGGVPVTFVSDYSDGESLGVCVKTINEFFKFKRSSLHLVRLVVVDADRKKRLAREIPADNIYDLTEYFTQMKIDSWAK